MVICCSETWSDKQLRSESCYQCFREVLHALILPWLSMRFTQPLPPLCIRPSVSACQDFQREVENSQGHKVHPSSTYSLSFNSYPLVHVDTWYWAQAQTIQEWPDNKYSKRCIWSPKIYSFPRATSPLARWLWFNLKSPCCGRQCKLLNGWWISTAYVFRSPSLTNTLLLH